VTPRSLRLLPVVVAVVACQRVPGDPRRFDPLGSARLVAEAVGLGENAALIELDASGRWTDGTLDTSRPETRLSYLFGDSSGARYSVKLREGELDVVVSRVSSRAFGWKADPECDAASIWNRLREDRAGVPSSGKLSLKAGKVELTLPSTGGAWVASADAVCAKIYVAFERDLHGCYVSAHTRRYMPLDASTFFDFAGRRFTAPLLGTTPPPLQRAVLDQLPAHRPEPWTYDVFGQAEYWTWTELRGRGRFHESGVVEFLTVDRTRPSSREACLSATTAP